MYAGDAFVGSLRYIKGGITISILPAPESGKFRGYRKGRSESIWHEDRRYQGWYSSDNSDLGMCI
ncbi:hypothetical protein IBTHAUMO2_690029 [Nitrosopumilaceae archaeon]|nr:hypothetical protein IBTHAUMO2_690029 [Nitrosopumilaceae archaeon]